MAVKHSDDSLDFILDLDKKLHYVEQGTFRPNMRGSSFKIGIDSYTDKKLSVTELEKLITIVDNSSEYIFHPINTCMGFSVGYAVSSTADASISLLQFRESQLPKSYTFDGLSKTFMSEKNLTKAKIIGLEICNDYGHYDY